MYLRGPDGGNVFNSELCLSNLMRALSQSGHIRTVEYALNEILDQ